MFIKSNKGLTDVSGCHIKLDHTPAHNDPVTDFSINERCDLVIEDFRHKYLKGKKGSLSTAKFTLATFKDKRSAEWAYSNIINAVREGESYVDITTDESDDQNEGKTPEEPQ